MWLYVHTYNIMVIINSDNCKFKTKRLKFVLLYFLLDEKSQLFLEMIFSFLQILLKYFTFFFRT